MVFTGKKKKKTVVMNPVLRKGVQTMTRKPQRVQALPADCHKLTKVRAGMGAEPKTSPLVADEKSLA